MRKQELIKRLENLSREYNELSSQLLDIDFHGNTGSSHKQLASTPHNIAEYEDKIEKLKTENSQLKKEIHFLKDHLSRCNQHLNRYVVKHNDTIPAYDTQSYTADESPSITRQSVYKLNALLLAYDEVINEQQSTIKRMTSSVENSLKRMKVLEEENKRFHNFYNAYNKEDYKGEDLRQVAEDAKLVLEERKILVEEVDLLKQKQMHMKQNYESKVKSIEMSLAQEKNLSTSLQERLTKSQSELESLQKSYTALHGQLLNSVAEEEHKKSVDECTKYLEKLKETYGNESSKMKKNVNEVHKEKKVLEDQLDKSSDKIKGMKKEVISYKTHIRKSFSHMNQQRNVIRALRLSRKHFQAKLRNLSSVCSKLLEDRKHLLQDMHGLKLESRRYSQEATNKSENLGRLSLKIKEDRLKMIQRLAETEGKRKAAEDAWSNCVKDIARLKKLLQSKEESLQALLSDVRFGFLKKQHYSVEDFR